jgi:hypothetical protein
MAKTGTVFATITSCLSDRKKIAGLALARQFRCKKYAFSVFLPSFLKNYIVEIKIIYHI